MREHLGEFELSNKMTNRIIGSVFWDHIIALARQSRQDLNVHVRHVVAEDNTGYETEMGTADDGAPEINGEAQLRAKTLVDLDGLATTHFRIQCRFEIALNGNGLIGFDQTGRIVDDFAVVDDIVERYYDDNEFSPWTKT